MLNSLLAQRDYLVGTFTVADILMVTVLRFINHTQIVSAFGNVQTYVERCEGRPAFRSALDAQLADFDRPRIAA